MVKQETELNWTELNLHQRPPHIIATFFVATDIPYIDSCLNLSTTATATKAYPQTAKKTSRQRPVILATDEKVKNGHKSYGTLMINCGNHILIVFHL